MALQSALEERVNTGLAADQITPLAYKELYEIILQGRFAASYHEVDDLTDRIPSTNPGAEPPRDTRDSGSTRSHSTHLETSSSDQP